MSTEEEKEMRMDEADDVMDLYEAMRDAAATYGLDKDDLRETAAKEGQTVAEFCKGCGGCDELRSIRKRINCRRKAAKKGMTLLALCMTCNRCE